MNTTPEVLPTTKLRKKPLNDHDLFVKGILGITELVHRLLMYYVPEHLKKYMDFSTLKLLSDTHIDKRLKVTFSDTIHECMLNVDKISADIKDREKLTKFRFCFLWEHKSSKPNEPIEFQVDDYRKSIIRADLKNKRPPSIVLPFLLYHGKDKWSNKLIYDQMSPYLPDEIMYFGCGTMLIISSGKYGDIWS